MERQISVYDAKTRGQKLLTISKRSPRLQNILPKCEDFYDEEHYYPIVGKGGEVTILDPRCRKGEHRPLRTTVRSYYSNSVPTNSDTAEERYVVQPGGTSTSRDYCKLAKSDLKTSTNSSPSSCRERDKIQALNRANKLARTRENLGKRSNSDAHLYVNPHETDEYCRIAGRQCHKPVKLRQNSLPTSKACGLNELHHLSTQNVVKISPRVPDSRCGQISRQSTHTDSANHNRIPERKENRPRERVLYSTSDSEDSDVECCGRDSDDFLDYCSCMCCVKGILYHYSKDTDNEGRLADEPCSCHGAGCLLRWGCLGVMSIFLPCLFCYLPAKGCIGVANQCKRRKKNYQSKKDSV